MDNREIGTRIRLARRDAGLTQEKLAEKIGVSTVFVSQLESGSRAPGLCMVLEDSYNGVRAGAAAGCFTVMVPDMDPPTPEMERLAWAIVPGLTDVARLLEQTDLQKR